MPSRSRFLAILLPALWAAGLSLPVAAQQPCAMPALPSFPRPANVLTEQQERDFGDAITEHVGREFLVIQDEEIVGRLRQIGDQLVNHLPQSDLKFQFFLLDIPIANAFAFPGGRIYVSRKLVAFSRTEDELAGVMAHEIGHIVTHQTAVDWTNLLRAVLGVSEFSDRQQIFEKYHDFIENVRRKKKLPQHSRKDVEREQIEADLVALYLVAQAGYSPRAYIEWWDRLAETKGKTGTWLSDFFGTTKPNSRRLREMLQASKTFPVACLEQRAAVANPDFERWKAAVVAYTGIGHREHLPGLLAKKELVPPLQNEFQHIRFSPDGKYLIAQNDSSIYVLTRDPFQHLFTIEAPEAHRAQFTPDSQAVVFDTSDLRVEMWSIEERQRADVTELVISSGCMQSLLSPDGRTLACLAGDFSLQLVSVDDGEAFFEKKAFFAPLLHEFLNILLAAIRYRDVDTEPRYINMSFSPDARYFLASSTNEKVGVDLTTRSPIPLAGGVKRALEGSFVFVGQDRIAGVRNGKDSVVVQFPSGQEVKKLMFGGARVSSPGRGNYVILRPVKDRPVGVMNLADEKVFLAYEKPGIDIWEKFYVIEFGNGELGLYDIGPNQLLARTILPRGTLGRLRAAAISSDFRWLVVSELSRGAIWNLAEGRRLYHTRGFRGAYIDEKQAAAFVDFPKFEKTERTILRLDLRAPDFQESIKLGEIRASQVGPFIQVWKPNKKDGRYDENVTLEFRETLTDKVLWSETFPKEPPYVHFTWRAGSVTFYWRLSADTAKDELKLDPAWQARAKAMDSKGDNYYLRAMDAATGRVLGRLLLDTGRGAIRIEEAFAVGDHMVIADSQNRILVYAISSGEQKSRIFGTDPVLSSTKALLAVEQGRGRFGIYELATLQRKAEFAFPRPVSLIKFSPDDKQLFVLTDNQIIYTLDLSAQRKTSAAQSFSVVP